MDVTQIEAAIIATQYWYKYQKEHERVNSKFIFVGDVHGDINQFLLPLIDTGTITLTGKVSSIKQKYVELDIHIPEYSCNKCSTEIYYLGDLVDGFIYSRQIVIMLANIMRQCKNVHLCFGNHEAKYIANLDPKSITLFTYEKHIESFRYLCSAYASLSLCRGKMIEQPGEDFLYEYYHPMLEAIKELWKMGEVMFYIETELGPFVVSHTITTTTALEDLGLEPKLSYKDLVNDINKAFKAKDTAYIGSNKLLWNRSDAKRVFPKQIVGHTIGGSFTFADDEESINPVPVRTNADRLKHCEPTNGVYYFDVGAAPNDLNLKFSMPDYFYIQDGKMNVTNANMLFLIWTGQTQLVEFDGKINKKILNFYTI